jgi:SAM-dependent methyltransferase
VTIVFDGLFDRLRKAIGGARSGDRERFRRIDEWLEGFELANARQLTDRVLSNPEWFDAELAGDSVQFPPGVPPTVRDFYGRYARVIGRFRDLRLVAAECGWSETDPTLLRVGWDSSHIELCAAPGSDRVYRIANDVPADEMREGSVPSIFHAVVRTAAILEYLPAPDPFGDRRPTSHERMTGVPWDASYHGGPAPWDIGRPQPPIVRLASAGGIRGSVLDVGCGTGENALYLASLGRSVLGVDVAETAVAIAREKARERAVEVEFAVADALHLERLGRRFDTVLDSGLFHTFDREERPEYVASLASAIVPGGMLYVLCFSDEGPETGPHPVSKDELRAAFGSGWRVVTIERDRVETRFHAAGAPAWLATIERTAGVGQGTGS